VLRGCYGFFRDSLLRARRVGDIGFDSLLCRPTECMLAQVYYKRGESGDLQAYTQQLQLIKCGSHEERLGNRVPVYPEFLFTFAAAAE
jgi:hypothetical protein